MSEESPVLEAVTEIVSAFVGNHKLPVDALPGLIQEVHRTLTGLTANPVQPAPTPSISKPMPAQIRKSITPSGLVSFEDGKTYKTLKRHLTGRGLTVAEYREKWGLPSTYPSTSPDYAAKRSALAKANGLGRKAVAPVSEPVLKPVKKGRGRPKAEA